MWVIKTKSGHEYDLVFKSYETAEDWLYSTLLKGATYVRDRYLIVPVD
jgi:hypothetical protein